MVKRNSIFSELHTSYLFAEIPRRIAAFREVNPTASLINLSIGDTSEPILKEVGLGLITGARKLTTKKGYEGYGPEQGKPELRRRISEVIYKEALALDEIFISDGAKCDIGRLHLLFGSDTTIAIQDPVFPLYIDTSRLIGKKQIFSLPCTPENGFFFDLKTMPRTDLIYLCSPNNPTGSVATKEQLTALVALAKKNKSIIIFDAAYSSYIQDERLPRSIYEIDGAKEVAIELCSFSKLIGFSGVRLGWTVVPKAIAYDGGGSLHTDWERVVTTFFNGASNIAQFGGYSALLLEKEKLSTLSNFYLENARMLGETLKSKQCKVYGGAHIPYLWVDFGKKRSWDLFQHFLEEMGIVSTPGRGFGICGEGFLRFSAFGPRSKILEAANRIVTRKWPQV